MALCRNRPAVSFPIVRINNEVGDLSSDFAWPGKVDVSAPDFYFCVNATARHIHDAYGKDVLIEYWQSLGSEYYANRAAAWKRGGPQAIANDWQTYFLHEPGAVVDATTNGDRVQLNISVCPAIKHLRESGREIVPYFCEHCDHTCGSMAKLAGYTFERVGGMGACQQFFTPAPTAPTTPG
jgi:hypothetical protein